MAKTPRHYVNNKTLYEEMVKFNDKVKVAKEEGKPLPLIPNYVGECFLLICNKLSNKPNFINYSYKDEMVADAIENCVSAAHSFNPERSTNPFAYFTQIAWNAFIRRIAKEKKQTYIKHKNFENSNLLSELLEDHNVVHNKNEYSSEIIKSFESKLTKNIKKSKVGIEKFTEETKDEELTPSAS